MRAVQLRATGPASNLTLVDLPIPTPKPGEVLIRIKAFGLNRTELIVRQTGFNAVGQKLNLPHIIGAEAVGVVEEAPGLEAQFPKGAIAFTAVGGLGVFRPGSDAQYTCVAKEQVQLVHSGAEKTLGWAVLGALPEMLMTAHGSLFRSLKLRKGDKLLIRGGTSSTGLAAAAIAKAEGATVFSTTRTVNAGSTKVLEEAGVSHVISDDGKIKDQVFKHAPNGVDKILELVGSATLPDSLSCLAPDGICCVTGLLGAQAAVPNWVTHAMLPPMPSSRYLTSYGEMTFKPSNLPLDHLIRQLESGELHIPLGKVFNLEEIVQAHEHLESTSGRGKVVVLTGM